MEKASDKRYLENLLGRQLQENQKIFIMAFTAGVVPDAAARHKALAGMQQTQGKVQRHMQEHGITDKEFDAAVDEAMEHVRRRES